MSADSHFAGTKLLVAMVLIVPVASETVNILGCTVAYGKSCEEVSFHLWTRTSPNTSQAVTSENLTLSDFNPTKPTKFIVHGYASDMNLDQLVAIRDAYLKNNDYNIIATDYSSLVTSPCYPTAVLNSKYAGKCIARFILNATGSGWLPSPGGIKEATQEPTPVHLHMVGFSLGAQTTSFVAKHVKPHYILRRITGLDPALPLFVTDDPNGKLVAEDALLVDVFHTNAYMQGKAERCGHVDFYFNGGMYQPGCPRDNVLSELKCCHHRAPTYFAESILSTDGFWGWPCTSIEDYERGLCTAKGDGVLMGERCDGSARGFFVVETNAEAPFARGVWWTQMNSTSTSPTRAPRVHLAS